MILGVFFSFALAGAIAQFIDGTLGMGFGVTSSTVLIFLGATPVAASSSVYFATIGTSLSSGIAHWREGNVDKVVLTRLAIPGAIGAFAGATVLTRISTESARGYMSTLLFLLGIVLIIRFGFGMRIVKPVKGRPRGYILSSLGGFAGFVTASGGGGWGPITTPTLLTLTKTHPRFVIGTVSAAEFLVAIAASAGFITAFITNPSNDNKIELVVVGGLLLGGVLIAPFAAKLSGRLPHAPLGVIVGGLVLLLNGRTILASLGFTGALVELSYLSFILIFTGVLAYRAWQKEKVEHTPHRPEDFAGPEKDLTE